MPISRRTLRRGPRCRQKLRCGTAQRRMALISINPALLERGDVWLVRFDPVEGHEQGSDRPGVIVSGSPFNSPGRALVAISRLSQHRLCVHRYPVDPGRGSPAAGPRKRDHSCSGAKWHVRTLATDTCAGQAPTLSRGEAALMVAEAPAGSSPTPATCGRSGPTSSAWITCSRFNSVGAWGFRVSRSGAINEQTSPTNRAESPAGTRKLAATGP